MDKKTILVTGGAGFIGSHLCERLVRDGHRVISLDNYSTGSHENHIPGAEYREGHTKDIEMLVPESPDIVYHLGEYPRAEKSFEDVELVWDLNQLGTFAVLEFCRRRGSKIVYAGSSTKFGDGGMGRDQSPYAWAKASMTDLVANYGAWFGLPYAITYFYNVYGPRERADAFGTVIEIFRQQRLRNLPLSVVSPGTQERIFTHVSDVVDALVLVGEKGEGGDYGIGSDERLSILELAKLFKGDVVMLPARPGNRQSAGINTEKTRALGWEPKKSVRDYIAACVREAGATRLYEKRVLVFTTTFHPVAGPAEEALCELMRVMPDIHFDIVTTRFSAQAANAPCPVENATIHRVGAGSPLDKYLLPFLGAYAATGLLKKHRYLFMWSLMASYGALAAVFARSGNETPLLVTLADQRLTTRVKMFTQFLLERADQVHASLPEQGKHVISLSERMVLRRSFGAGDVFANPIRFAYSQILRAKPRR